MQIEIGKNYLNKTWKYLLPCLRGHGNTFSSKFNMVYKLAVGIHDTLVDGSKLSEGRNIYLLCDKKHRERDFIMFHQWLENQPYFKGSYSADKDILKDRKMVLIIGIPEQYYGAYDKFLQGKYSEMYSEKELKELKFSEESLGTLNRTFNAAERYLQVLNKEFMMDYKLEDILDHTEYDIPLIRTLEIFNCQKIDERVYFCEEQDKVWKI